MHPTPLNLGILASHGGSNMQAIINAYKMGKLYAKTCVVLSNNPNSFALVRAKKERIPALCFNRCTHPNPADLDKIILQTLKEYHVDLVILAGYMRPLGIQTLTHYHNRVLNIHPALLPKFGGKDMYGLRIHEAVIAAKERVSGVTVHLVDDHYDHGKIIAQRKVPVLASDSPQSLADRVLKQEHLIYTDTIQKICLNEIDLDSG